MSGFKMQGHNRTIKRHQDTDDAYSQNMNDTDENIDRLLVMPPLVKAKLFMDTKNGLQHLKASDPKIYQVLQPLYETLSTYFDIYQFTEYDFHFRFPPSKFSLAEVPKINVGSHQRINEDTFRNQFQAKQLRSVWLKGTFEVDSQISTVPYVWKVHPLIIKGLHNVIESWYNDVSASYHQLRQVQKRFVGDTLSLKLNLTEFSYYPERIANMLVGVKQMRVMCTPDLDRIVEIRFMLHKYMGYYNKTPQQLTERLKVPVLIDSKHQQQINQLDVHQKASNLLRQNLNKIDSSFEVDWKPYERQRIRQYRNESQNPESKQIQQILRKQKEQRYDIWLREKLPKDIQDQSFALLRVFILIRRLLAEKDKKISESRQKIEDELRAKHKIRHRSPYFWSETIERRMKPIIEDAEQNFWATLKSQLHDKLFDDYMQFRQDFGKQVQELKAKYPVLYGPRRTFYSTYRMFPPYEIKLEHGYYSLKKYKELQTDTGHHFWKFSLYKMRLISWTRNCFFWLVANAWSGPFGIRVLFSIQAFNTEQHINSRTGQIYYSRQDSLLIHFNRVLSGISESRRHFESQPDTGFFGKKFSRIFNLIECYIFRFLIVGVLIVLILYPIAIVVISVLSFILAITSWLWTPLCMLVCYLFNILIYQFEIDDNYRRNRYSERWFPLISTPLMFILNNVRIIAYLIGALIVHPLLSAILAVYAVLHFVFSYITDFMTYYVVKLLARTPSRDTKIAWKISGPGMSRQFYDSIAEEDVYILVEAQLEKIYLQKFRDQAIKKINQPQRRFDRVYRQTLSTLEGHPKNPNSSVIKEQTGLLHRLFNNQFQQWHNRYPQVYNLRRVRFTAEERDHYLENCVKLVRKFVETNECTWVFAVRNLDFGDYDELTKSILRDIFSHEIMEPFEDLEMRFELKDKEQGRQKQAILRALHGEVELHLRKPTTKRQLKTFNVSDTYIPKLSSVVDVLRNVSSGYVTSTRDNPETALMINPWIERIIRYDITNNRYDRYEPETR